MQKSIQNALFCGVICLVTGILLASLFHVSQLILAISFLLIGGGYLLYRRYVLQQGEQFRIAGMTGRGLIFMVFGLLPLLVRNVTYSDLNFTTEGIFIILALVMFVLGLFFIVRAYFRGHLSNDIHMTNGYFWAMVFLITSVLIFVLPLPH